MSQIIDALATQEWRDHLADVAAQHEPGWEAQYRPGTFGCHELLDRVSLIGELVEGQVLEHPACALRPEWHQLAVRAVEALRELYQSVGGTHMAEERTD